MQIDTRSSGLFRAYSTNDATVGTTFTNPVDVQVEPTMAGNGYIKLGAGNSVGPNGLFLIPFGRATTNNFFMAVYGCDEVIQTGAGNARTWTHYLLASFAVTLGAQTGLAGSDIVVADIYASAIVPTAAVVNVNVSCETISPSATAPVSGNKASILMDTKAAQWAKILFARNSSATQCNTLARVV